MFELTLMDIYKILVAIVIVSIIAGFVDAWWDYRKRKKGD